MEGIISEEKTKSNELDILAKNRMQQMKLLRDYIELKELSQQDTEKLQKEVRLFILFLCSY